MSEKSLREKGFFGSGVFLGIFKLTFLEDYVRI